MSECMIRPMKEADAEAIHVLFQKCFSDPWSLQAIQEMFQTNGYHNLVAVCDGIICGYVGIKSVLDEADIVNVAVDPSHRRRGLGRRMLEELLQLAKCEEIGHIFLEVRESNVAAIGLYEQAGFFKIGLRKNYYTNPKEHAILMVWE